VPPRSTEPRYVEWRTVNRTFARLGAVLFTALASCAPAEAPRLTSEAMPSVEPTSSSQPQALSIPLPSRPPPPTPATTERLRRHTIQVDDSGVRAALLAAGLAADAIDALDAALLGRADLFSVRGAMTLWTKDSRLVAASIPMGSRLVLAGVAEGRAGEWFDEDGFSLAGPVLARPLRLSVITSRFGERLHPLRGTKQHHEGVDYGAATGTPVLVVGDGVVVASGEGEGAGRFIKVRHALGYESSYLHLAKPAPGIRQGARVKQGETIGFVGSTGASTGPHLHYELRNGGVLVDPLRTLPLPTTALGPMAQSAHRAYLRGLP